MVAICLVVGENYPFSTFPMYDQFPDHTYYIFVKDGQNRPIALQEVTGTRTASFKKPYDDDIDRVRDKLDKRKRELTAAERKPAGLRALEDLYARAPEPARQRLEALAPLQLYHAKILMVDGKMVEPEPELIATLELPESESGEPAPE